MFKEVLLITPKLSNADLSAMDRSLNRRFTSIAKRFGKGLLGALAGGGLVGIAAGLIDKLLNPLKEIQEAISRTLEQGDDLATNAKQFNASPGELGYLMAHAKAAGLDTATLFTALSKYQTALAEAKADPTKDTPVRQYANDKNVVQSFIEFLEQMKLKDKDKQILIQQDLFGEKFILKMAQFSQRNLSDNRTIGGPGVKAVSAAAEKIDQVAGLEKLKGAQNWLKDFVEKSNGISSDIILLQEAERERKQREENKDLQAYQNFAAFSELAEFIKSVPKDALRNYADYHVKAARFFDDIAKWIKTPFARDGISKQKRDR